ncbi:M56 family metallopeptidase [Maribacter sp. HTCC2170]|uniref:M56 family metallopeptidase n=1 Tax=Maribacter sp. (strain HTCC2170 / KCCM 42371) TaxID=313603 RepID=UPI00006BD487|nr:M56 family metallopeptidase [Maribacter sp. HTCC2170]EAR02337.1 TonB [Maribacter sp. HTCC2170]
MIQYIIEFIGFQLVFLIVYDFFLRRETFFQWNRLYLIGTHVLSLFLPWLKIEAFRTEIPIEYYLYPEFLWNIQNEPISLGTDSKSVISLSWQESVFVLGVLIGLGLFIYKMAKLYQLRKNGEIQFFSEYTQIVVANSNLAFSFFKSIFLGDQVIKDEHDKIIQHELVHIRQKHSLDLVFFELLRIICWFNPLVYIYQSRVSELHEFIADAQVAKGNKKEQYQMMLSQVFQTQHISFVNQFFKTSLIKKRIIMLQKTKSKKVWQLKYLLLIPLMSGMLLYTSCNYEDKKEVAESEVTLSEKISKLKEEIEAKGSLTDEEKGQLALLIYKTYPKDIGGISGEEGSIEYSGVPFAIVDEVPVFPGCEDANDKIECFNTNLVNHIKKHFSYPIKAQELGIQGRVNILFSIASNGMINNIKTKGPNELLEEEAKRIIGKLPRMTPGKHKGKVVHVPFSIPISFKLQ